MQFRQVIRFEIFNLNPIIGQIKLLQLRQFRNIFNHCDQIILEVQFIEILQNVNILNFRNLIMREIEYS